MTRAPRVSVLMPAYQAEPYIHEAVTSVLAQTFADFELIVLDDGSTDGTARVVRAIRDPRVRRWCVPIGGWPPLATSSWPGPGRVRRGHGRRRHRDARAP